MPGNCAGDKKSKTPSRLMKIKPSPAWHVMRAHRFIRAMETNWKDLSKITFHATVHQLVQPPMRNATGGQE